MSKKTKGQESLSALEDVTMADSVAAESHCHDDEHHGHAHTHAHSHEHHDHAHTHEHDHHHHYGHSHDHHHGHSHGGNNVLTVRASSGLSGDIMLAGLASLAGLDQAGLDALVDELHLDALRGSVTLQDKSVNQIAGVGCKVELPHEHAHRNLTDILKIIDNSAMPDEAKGLAAKAFTLLAQAEGEVHGMATEEVTFHEVGALDSILDTCLVCRIFTMLKPDKFVCNPLPLADGVVCCAHGRVPSPAPAVLRLLDGVPVCGFTGEGETVTPTAISLLKALGAEFGPWPAMVLRQSVISYGNKVFANAPNGALWVMGATQGATMGSASAEDVCLERAV